MKGMPYRVYIPIMDSDKVAEMVNWCYTNVDRHNLTWEWSYVTDLDTDSDVHFYFRDPKQATLFSLKFT